MIRIVKSEWHQMERRYGLVVTMDDIEQIYPDNTPEENQEVMDRLISEDLSADDLIEDSNDASVYLDWEWLDEDDLWTDRKGGYEVTYEIEEDYQVPLTQSEIIEQLKSKVAELEKQLSKKGKK